MKKGVLSIVCACMFLSCYLVVAAELPMIGADVAMKSKYVWRGMPFNTEAVLWPDVWVYWYGASITGWASIDLTDVKDEQMQFTDIALIGDYTHALGPVTGSLGYMHYIYPGYADAFPSTGEVYAKLAGGYGPATLTLTGIYDVIEVNGIYVTPSLSLSHSLDFIAPTLTISAGYADGKHNTYYFGIDKGGLTDITATLSIAITPPGALANYLGLGFDVNYAKILDSELADVYAVTDDDENLYWGVGINLFYSFGGE